MKSIIAHILLLTACFSMLSCKYEHLQRRYRSEVKTVQSETSFYNSDGKIERTEKYAQEQRKTDFQDESPKDAKAIGPIIVDENKGILQQGNTETWKPIEPTPIHENATMFYWISIAMVVATIIGVFLKQYGFAAIMFISGLIIALIPNLISSLTPYLPHVAIGSVLVGIIYVIYKKLRSNKNPIPQTEVAE